MSFRVVLEGGLLGPESLLFPLEDAVPSTNFVVTFRYLALADCGSARRPTGVAHARWKDRDLKQVAVDNLLRDSAGMPLVFKLLNRPCLVIGLLFSYPLLPGKVTRSTPLSRSDEFKMRHWICLFFHAAGP